MYLFNMKKDCTQEQKQFSKLFHENGRFLNPRYTSRNTAIMVVAKLASLSVLYIQAVMYHSAQRSNKLPSTFFTVMCHVSTNQEWYPLPLFRYFGHFFHDWRWRSIYLPQLLYHSHLLSEFCAGKPIPKYMKGRCVETWGVEEPNSVKNHRTWKDGEPSLALLFQLETHKGSSISSTGEIYVQPVIFQIRKIA